MSNVPTAPSTSDGRLASLESLLRRTPSAFDFFQAVRLLERVRPDRSAVGRFVDPAAEVVRFTVNPAIAFPAATIHGVALPEDGQAEMNVSFFGLTGPLGVLPHAYSLLVVERLRARDGALAAFLDMFHHRMISLFYRAWQKNQITAAGNDELAGDRLTEHLLDLIGLGIDAQRAGPSQFQRALLSYAGLLCPQTRGAVALEQLLENVFDVPVDIEQFVSGTYRLATRDQCALGADDASNQLGAGAVVGDEVWDCQTRVRIRIGPLDAQQYNDFLPDGSAYELLRWLVRFFGRDAFDFEVQLILAREQVEGCRLDIDDVSPQPLGWSTWIRTAPLTRDADETVLAL